MPNYQTLVREARSCVDEVEARGWRLAELCWQAKHEHGKSYAQFARDLGRLSAGALSKYASVWTNREALPDSFGEAIVNMQTPEDVWAEAEEYAEARGVKPATGRQELMYSRRVVSQAPPEIAAELARTALARPEVREALAADSDAAGELYMATTDVTQREDRQRGIDRSKVITGRRSPALDRMAAELEILVKMHELVKLAQEHGLEDYLIEQWEQARLRLEMGDPKRGVAELEKYLAEQGEAA